MANRYAGFVIVRDTLEMGDEKELYWDDEERDPNAPNPDTMLDMELPAEFEFNEAIQNAP